MKRNMGIADRVIRVAVAIGILILYLTDVISGWLAIVLGIVAVVFALTSILGFCPLYVPFGLSTKKE